MRIGLALPHYDFSFPDGKPLSWERLMEAAQKAEGLGFDSVRFRFLGAKKDLTPAELRYFTELDFSGHVGLVAVRRHDVEEEFIGLLTRLCQGLQVQALKPGARFLSRLARKDWGV